MAHLGTVNIVVPNKHNLEFRSLELSDAPKFILFMTQIARETTHTLQYENREYSLSLVEKNLGDGWSDPSKLNIGFFDQGQLIGYLGFQALNIKHPWVKHVGSFGMMILKNYWGIGLGSKLIDQMEIFAVLIALNPMVCQKNFLT